MNCKITALPLPTTDQSAPAAPAEECSRGHTAPVEVFVGAYGAETKLCRGADGRYQNF